MTNGLGATSPTNLLNKDKMTVKELIDTIIDNLQPLYDRREAAAIANLYVQSRTGLPNYEVALRKNESVSDSLLNLFREDIISLKRGVPVQHVLGEAEFYGLRFAVSPSVLIPRPETEELVQMVVNECSDQEVRILDIGTGSGCIAISLAKLLPKASVFATDISSDALEIAKKNAAENGVGVTFTRHDILSGTVPFMNTDFDIIVSNPPYVPFSDRSAMHVNVAEHDPETALFVPDNDIFVFYRAIAKTGINVLKDNGIIFVETYHLHQERLAEMFKNNGYSRVGQIEDLNGKQRFLRVEI